MGYYVRHLAWKKSAPQWKIQFLSYKKQDCAASSATKPKKEWDVPKVQSDVACATDSHCANPRAEKINKVAFWIAASLTAFTILYPTILERFGE